MIDRRYEVEHVNEMFDIGDDLKFGGDYIFIDRLVNFLNKSKKEHGATHVLLFKQSYITDMEEREIVPVVIKQESEEEFSKRKSNYARYFLSEEKERLLYEKLKSKFE